MKHDKETLYVRNRSTRNYTPKSCEKEIKVIWASSESSRFGEAIDAPEKIKTSRVLETCMAGS